MDPTLKQNLQALTQRLAARPTRIIGTRELREKLANHLSGAIEANVVVLDHGTPRAAILDYETYDALMHLVRLVTFEVTDEAVDELTEAEWQAIEARRDRHSARRQSA